MNTDTCSFHQFVMVLAHFQPSTNKTQDTDINSRVSKGTFIFNSFDKNQDGRIYVHNIEAVLQYMVGATVSEEKLKIIANQIYQDAKARTPDSQPGITFEELALTMKPVNLEINGCSNINYINVTKLFIIKFILKWILISKLKP